MPLTTHQTRLAETIDAHVRATLRQGGGDEALLLSLADHMGTFKQVLDTCTGAEMHVLCERYEGFYRCAKLLETLAEGIADGSIPVPEYTGNIREYPGLSRHGRVIVGDFPRGHVL
jgi:hypothetical protein